MLALSKNTVFQLTPFEFSGFVCEQDDNLIDEFYKEIIENYNYGENYYIILIHVAYDIPGKSTDGSEMFDASDEVYEYLLPPSKSNDNLS